MIDMTKITEYVSIEQQMLLDAQKYIDRAKVYLDNNQSKHALGCMIKAYKKYEKYEQFKSSSDAISNLVLYPLSKEIANKILFGSQNANTKGLLGADIKAKSSSSY